MATAPCATRLDDLDRDWFRLYAAIGARDARTIATVATRLLEKVPDLRPAQVQYLLTAGLAGHVANRDLDAGVRLWNAHANVASQAGIDLNLRMLFGQLAAAGKTEAMSPLR